jgi:hypothetical protein
MYNSLVRDGAFQSDYLNRAITKKDEKFIKLNDNEKINNQDVLSNQTRESLFQKLSSKDGNKNSDRPVKYIFN